jgi:hypothetical protein
MTQTPGIARTYAATAGCEIRPQREHLPAKEQPHMDSLPARDGAAARLAHLMHERGLSASVRPAGRAMLLTVRNPAIPFGALTQRVALVPHDEHGEAFVWVFDGAERGTWDTELIGPASEVDATADRLVRVLAVAGQDGHDG